jgi:hypothetical protein
MRLGREGGLSRRRCRARRGRPAGRSPPRARPLGLVRSKASGQRLAKGWSKAGQKLVKGPGAVEGLRAARLHLPLITLMNAWNHEWAVAARRPPPAGAAHRPQTRVSVRPRERRRGPHRARTTAPPTRPCAPPLPPCAHFRPPILTHTRPSGTPHDPPPAPHSTPAPRGRTRAGARAGLRAQQP